MKLFFSLLIAILAINSINAVSLTDQKFLGEPLSLETQTIIVNGEVYDDVLGVEKVGNVKIVSILECNPQDQEILAPPTPYEEEYQPLTPTQEIESSVEHILEEYPGAEVTVTEVTVTEVERIIDVINPNGEVITQVETSTQVETIEETPEGITVVNEEVNEVVIDNNGEVEVETTIETVTEEPNGEVVIETTEVVVPPSGVIEIETTTVIEQPNGEEEVIVTVEVGNEVETEVVNPPNVPHHIEYIQEGEVINGQGTIEVIGGQTIITVIDNCIPPEEPNQENERSGFITGANGAGIYHPEFEIFEGEAQISRFITGANGEGIYHPTIEITKIESELPEFEIFEGEAQISRFITGANGEGIYYPTIEITKIESELPEFEIFEGEAQISRFITGANGEGIYHPTIEITKIESELPEFEIFEGEAQISRFITGANGEGIYHPTIGIAKIESELPEFEIFEGEAQISRFITGANGEGIYHPTIEIAKIESELPEFEIFEGEAQISRFITGANGEGIYHPTIGIAKIESELPEFEIFEGEAQISRFITGANGEGIYHPTIGIAKIESELPEFEIFEGEAQVSRFITGANGEGIYRPDIKIAKIESEVSGQQNAGNVVVLNPQQAGPISYKDANGETQFGYGTVTNVDGTQIVSLVDNHCTTGVEVAESFWSVGDAEYYYGEVPGEVVSKTPEILVEGAPESFWSVGEAEYYYGEVPEEGVSKTPEILVERAPESFWSVGEAEYYYGEGVSGNTLTPETIVGVPESFWSVGEAEYYYGVIPGEVLLENNEEKPTIGNIVNPNEPHQIIYRDENGEVEHGFGTVVTIGETEFVTLVEQCAGEETHHGETHHEETHQTEIGGVITEIETLVNELEHEFPGSNVIVTEETVVEVETEVVIVTPENEVIIETVTETETVVIEETPEGITEVVEAENTVDNNGEVTTETTTTVELPNGEITETEVVIQPNGEVEVHETVNGEEVEVIIPGSENEVEIHGNVVVNPNEPHQIIYHDENGELEHGFGTVVNIGEAEFVTLVEQCTGEETHHEESHQTEREYEFPGSDIIPNEEIETHQTEIGGVITEIENLVNELEHEFPGSHVIVTEETVVKTETEIVIVTPGNEVIIETVTETETVVIEETPEGTITVVEVEHTVDNNGEVTTETTTTVELPNGEITETEVVIQPNGEVEVHETVNGEEVEVIIPGSENEVEIHGNVVVNPNEPHQIIYHDENGELEHGFGTVVNIGEAEFVTLVEQCTGEETHHEESHQTEREYEFPGSDIIPNEEIEAHQTETEREYEFPGSDIIPNEEIEIHQTEIEGVITEIETLVNELEHEFPGSNVIVTEETVVEVETEVVIVTPENEVIIETVTETETVVIEETPEGITEVVEAENTVDNNGEVTTETTTTVELPNGEITETEVVIQPNGEVEVHETVNGEEVEVIIPGSENEVEIHGNVVVNPNEPHPIIFHNENGELEHGIGTIITIGETEYITLVEQCTSEETHHEGPHHEEAHHEETHHEGSHHEETTPVIITPIGYEVEEETTTPVIEQEEEVNTPVVIEIENIVNKYEEEYPGAVVIVTEEVKTEVISEVVINLPNGETITESTTTTETNTIEETPEGITTVVEAEVIHDNNGEVETITETVVVTPNGEVETNEVIVYPNGETEVIVPGSETGNEVESNSNQVNPNEPHQITYTGENGEVHHGYGTVITVGNTEFVTLVEECTHEQGQVETEPELIIDYWEELEELEEGEQESVEVNIELEEEESGITITPYPYEIERESEITPESVIDYWEEGEEAVEEGEQESVEVNIELEEEEATAIIYKPEYNENSREAETTENPVYEGQTAIQAELIGGKVEIIPFAPVEEPTVHATGFVPAEPHFITYHDVNGETIEAIGTITTENGIEVVTIYNECENNNEIPPVIPHTPIFGGNSGDYLPSELGNANPSEVVELLREYERLAGGQVEFQDNVVYHRDDTIDVIEPNGKTFEANNEDTIVVDTTITPSGAIRTFTSFEDVVVNGEIVEEIVTADTINALTGEIVSAVTFDNGKQVESSLPLVEPEYVEYENNFEIPAIYNQGPRWITTEEGIEVPLVYATAPMITYTAELESVSETENIQPLEFSGTHNQEFDLETGNFNYELNEILRVYEETPGFYINEEGYEVPIVFATGPEFPIGFEAESIPEAEVFTTEIETIQTETVVVIELPNGETITEVKTYTEVVTVEETPEGVITTTETEVSNDNNGEVTSETTTTIETENGEITVTVTEVGNEVSTEVQGSINPTVPHDITFTDANGETIHAYGTIVTVEGIEFVNLYGECENPNKPNSENEQEEEVEEGFEQQEEVEEGFEQEEEGFEQEEEGFEQQEEEVEEGFEQEEEEEGFEQVEEEGFEQEEETEGTSEIEGEVINHLVEVIETVSELTPADIVKVIEDIDKEDEVEILVDQKTVVVVETVIDVIHDDGKIENIVVDRIDVIDTKINGNEATTEETTIDVVEINGENVEVIAHTVEVNDLTGEIITPVVGPHHETPTEYHNEVSIEFPTSNEENLIFPTPSHEFETTEHENEIAINSEEEYPGPTTIVTEEEVTEVSTNVVVISPNGEVITEETTTTTETITTEVTPTESITVVVTETEVTVNGETETETVIVTENNETGEVEVVVTHEESSVNPAEIQIVVVNCDENNHPIMPPVNPEHHEHTPENHEQTPEVPFPSEGGNNSNEEHHPYYPNYEIEGEHNHVEVEVPYHHVEVEVPYHHGEVVVPIHHGEVEVPIHHGEVEVPIHHGEVEVPIHHGEVIVPIHHGEVEVIVPHYHNEVEVEVPIHHGEVEIIVPGEVEHHHHEIEVPTNHEEEKGRVIAGVEIEEGEEEEEEEEETYTPIEIEEYEIEHNHPHHHNHHEEEVEVHHPHNHNHHEEEEVEVHYHNHHHEEENTITVIEYPNEEEEIEGVETEVEENESGIIIEPPSHCANGQTYLGTTEMVFGANSYFYEKSTKDVVYSYTGSITTSSNGNTKQSYVDYGVDFSGESVETVFHTSSEQVIDGETQISGCSGWWEEENVDFTNSECEQAVWFREHCNIFDELTKKSIPANEVNFGTLRGQSLLYSQWKCDSGDNSWVFDFDKCLWINVKGDKSIFETSKLDKLAQEQN